MSVGGDRLVVSTDHEFVASGQKLKFALDMPADGVIGVFGASGSGKTSLLRLIAGLLDAKSSVVRFKGEDWQSENTFVPAHRRQIAYVFQEASLFAHLSVEKNIAFAEKRAKLSSIDINKVIQILEIKGLMNRKSGALSGGEQQRVAIARALASSPRLILLDEPLSALDAKLKAEILPLLLKIKLELDIPMVYVSHSAEELAMLADYLVLVEHGRITRAGPITEVFPYLGGEQLPISVLIEAVIGSDADQWQLSTAKFSGGELTIQSPHKTVGTPLRIRIQARDVSISLSDMDQSSILNRIPAEIVKIEPIDASMALVRARVGDLENGTDFLIQITQKSLHQLTDPKFDHHQGLQIGQKVFLQIKSVAILD